MDQILAKHLVDKLIFSKVEKSGLLPVSESNIPYHEYKIIDECYYIKTDEDTIVSDLLGYWKDKPVVYYNDKRYVVLENSKTLVDADNLGVTQLSKKTTVPVKKESPPLEPKKSTEEKKVDKKDIESSYVSVLKKEDERSEDKNEVSETIEDDFFSVLEKKKDDPRVKKFFNYHADQAKKELFSITEKFTKQQMARAMESGGGTNAAQYANGGTMRGNLVIEGDLTVTGSTNTGGGGNSKKVFQIGNGVDREYVLVHSLNTKDVIVSLYDQNDENVFAGVKNISVNETKVSFTDIVSLNSIKVVIIG